jgi:hypothetical protein
MVENSSKLVSIHSDECHTGCPNIDVCYFVKRKESKVVNLTDLRLKAISAGYIVHEAISSIIQPTDARLNLVRINKNYNLTVSRNLFDYNITLTRELSYLPINQVQVSCYDHRDLFRFIDYQKLFLIKDEVTFNTYKEIQNDIRLTKVHFTIDQQWLTSSTLKEIVEIHNSSPLHKITLDSCLSNWVVHGKCMYMENYIDLSTDGTFRKCPFKVEGMPINDKTIKEMIQYTEPVTCKYQKIFNEGIFK